MLNLFDSSGRRNDCHMLPGLCVGPDCRDHLHLRHAPAWRLHWHLQPRLDSDLYLRRCACVGRAHESDDYVCGCADGAMFGAQRCVLFSIQFNSIQFAVHHLVERFLLVVVLKPSCQLRVSTHLHISRVYCDLTVCLLANGTPI